MSFFIVNGWSSLVVRRYVYYVLSRVLILGENIGRFLIAERPV